MYKKTLGLSTLIQADRSQKKVAVKYVGAPIDEITGKKGLNEALVMNRQWWAKYFVLWEPNSVSGSTITGARPLEKNKATLNPLLSILSPRLSHNLQDTGNSI